MARVGDMHVCPAATGPVPHVGGPLVTPNSAAVLAAGMPVATVTCQAVCVGPPDIATKGSTAVLVGGMPALRMTDQTAHGGVIIVGCPTVLVG